MRVGHDPRYRWRYLADILLHEMIHQWQYQHGSPSKTKHDVEFAAKCNEIADQLDLGHVVSRRRKGDPVKLPIAALWPPNVRPDGYYGDLWDEISEPEQPEDWLSQILALWEAGAPPDQLAFLQRIGVTISGAPDAAEEPVAITNDDTSLHERIKAARLARGWSQRELAKAAGTHAPVVSKVENGHPVAAAPMARILAVLESA